jgi:tetratricopeptide (TPR) repeat protein
MTPTGDPAIQQALDAALEHHRQGRFVEAETLYRQILVTHPDHPQALHLLGTLAGQVGRFDAAIPLIQRAIGLNPSVAMFYNNLAECLRSTGRKQESADAFAQAVRLQPQTAMFLANLSGALLDLSKWDEGAEAARKAIAADPNFAIAHGNLGSALTEMGLPEEAVIALRRAIELNPNYADGYNNLGAALMGLGRFDEGAEAYRQAIRLQPEFGEAHMNLSGALIFNGDWQGGWREYEWRGRAKRGWDPPQQFPQPRWQGEPPAGKRILLHCEQGVGDTLQMLRYVPLIAAKGGRVIVQCQPPLHRLLASQSGVEQVVPLGSSLPEFDVHCPFMSLPMVMQTGPATLPANVPYVNGDPKLAEAMASVVAGPPGLKVGIAWAGNPSFMHDRFRSTSLDRLASLAKATGVRWFSLQKGDAAAQLKNPPPGMGITDLSAHLNDFADTAAVMANLDLVISTCTSVAHLAGAMGRPLWVMLSTSADWRWLRDRSDSLWYPTARLFRQPRQGDWEAVAQAIADELHKMRNT